MRLVTSLGVGFLAFSSVAAAQHAPRGTMIGTSAGAGGIRWSALPSGARVLPAAPSVRVSGSSGARRMQVFDQEFASFQTTPFGTFPLQTVRFDNVPGLGFDYPHLAAVTHGQPRQRPVFDGVASLGFQGIFLWPLVAPPTVVIVQQPPIVEVPEYANAANYSESIRDREPEIDARAPRSAHSEPAPQTETSAREAVPAPQKDCAQYVFVQRDGSLLFAVAYSWEKGLLRYITPEGLKRSVARDKLDLDATQQFNEQRGLVFRFPA